MNFTRMLASDWSLPSQRSVQESSKKYRKYSVDLLLEYYRKYKSKAEHDQKLLNIMFHFNPGTWHTPTRHAISSFGRFAIHVHAKLMLGKVRISVRIFYATAARNISFNQFAGRCNFLEGAVLMPAVLVF